MPPDARYQKCAAQHFGPWMVDSKWFAQAVSAVKAGTFKPITIESAPAKLTREERESAEAMVDDGNVVGEWSDDGWTYNVLYYIEQGCIARIPMSGQVTKGESSYGGFSSVWSRRAVRKAISDDRITAILLHIDSPGGTVAGTGDLADDVAKADGIKPVYTYFEDLGASAAYWIGCQARYVWANPTADIGSIGTMTYVEDTSGMYEKAGIKVTLIATGPIKGQWVDGNPVSEEYIESVRTDVFDLNEHFLAGVMSGREMSRGQVEAVADGRCWIASKALQNGLIDEIASLDAAMSAIVRSVSIMNDQQFTTFLAEHPDHPALAGVKSKAFDEGKAGAESAARAAATADTARIDGIAEAFECKDHPAVAAIKSGMNVETAKIVANSTKQATAAATAQIAAMRAENDRLQATIGNQPAIPTAGAAAAAAAAASAAAGGAQDVSDPEVAAKAEWAKMSAADKAAWSDEKTFVGLRKLEAEGKVRTKK